MSTSLIVKAYVSTRPRIFGLFHWGKAAGDSPRTLERAGYFGLIANIGPCGCPDPKHKFPEYYSITPCVFVHFFGKILTMQISKGILSAILWFQGPSDL